MADIEKITHIGLVPAELINDLRQIIDSARSHVAATANYELTAMYWNIGNRINRDMLNNERAEYGKQIVSQVATELQQEYGKGFEERTIRRMMQFAQMFPDFQIVSPLVSKLSWTHFLIVMPLKDALQREFYLTMAATERWSCTCVGWRNTRCNRAKKRRLDCYSVRKEVTNKSVCCN